MKIMKLLSIIIFLPLLFVRCNTEYEYKTAYVYETRFVHRDSGYYKLKILYNFEYQDTICKGSCKTPGTYRIYGRKLFREGDSVFIKFPVGKPEKSELANYMVKRKK